MPVKFGATRPSSPASTTGRPPTSPFSGSRPRPMALRAETADLPSPPAASDPVETAVAAAGAKPALLKPKEVADMLAVSERTLERWRITGEGPRFVRLGSKVVRYTGEELEAFVAARVKANTGQ